jgi:hypothetical protein
MSRVTNSILVDFTKPFSTQHGAYNKHEHLVLHVRPGLTDDVGDKAQDVSRKKHTVTYSRHDAGDNPVRNDPNSPFSLRPTSLNLDSFNFRKETDASFISVADSDHISFDDNPGPSPFSISFWFRGDPDIPQWSYYFGKSSEYWARMSNITTSPDMTFYLESSSGNTVGLSTAVNLGMDGKWHHYVITYNGVYNSRSIKIYVDGALDAAGSGSTSGTYAGMTPASNNLLWGTRYSGSSNAMKGNMSEMAMWNTVLGVADVKAIYESTKGISHSGYINDAPRLQIRDQDHRLGTYPTIARTGDPDFLGKSNSYYDDTKTVDFISSYARAWIQFKEVPITESTITLSDASGKSKTFVFIRSFPPGWVKPTGYEVVRLAMTLPSGETKSLANLTEDELKFLNPGMMTNMKFASNWQQFKGQWADPGVGLGGLEFSGIDEEPKATISWSIPHLLIVAQKFARAVMDVYRKGELKITANAPGGDNIGRVVLVQSIAGTAGNESGNDNLIQSYKKQQAPEGGVSQGLIQWTSSSFSGGKSLDVIHSTGMLSGSGYNDNLLSSPNTMPDISSPGTVSRDVLLGNNFQFHVSDETITPFDESRIYLGNPESVFYKNSNDKLPMGSGLRTVDPRRFGSPLRDKTIITVDINPVAETKVWMSTGSNVAAESHLGGGGASYGSSAEGLASGINSGLVYYNFDRKVWEAIGDFTTGSNVDVVNRHPSIRPGTMLAFAGGPFSGHYGEGAFGNLNPNFINTARASGMPTNYAGFPVASKFNATGSQLLDMSNYITHPFLLEKVVIEWSGTVGAYPANFENTPCVASNQFFILNQYQNSIQKTFTRTNHYMITHNTPNLVYEQEASWDCTRYKELVWFGRVGVYDEGAIDDVDSDTKNAAGWNSSTTVLSALTSSKAESVDLWISADDADTAPSGTFMIEKPVTCPIRSPYSVGPFHGRYLESLGAESKLYHDFFLGVDGSRDLFGTPSGRSYQRAVPGSSKLVGNNSPFTPHGPNADSNRTDFKITPYAKYEDVSPYLLMPTDKLIIGFANQQIPFVVTSSAGSGQSNIRGPQGESEYDLGFSGSHVSNFSPGRGRVTFYGSHIRMGKEYHSTVNQPLTSPALHEALHFDNPIVDQHVVEPTLNYSGSYVDNVVDGLVPRVDTTESSTGAGAGSGIFNDVNISGQGTLGADATYTRAVVGSGVRGTAGTTGSMVRFRAFSDRSERYLDSMPGNPADYHVTNGFNLLSGYGAYTGVGFLAVASPNANASIGSYDSVVDSLWPRAFPFEPKYSTILRMKSLSDLDKKLPASNLAGVSTPKVSMDRMIALSNDISIITVDGKWSADAPGVTRKMLKYYFGIGQRKDTGTFSSAYNHRGEVTNTDGNIISAKVELRGFKYGLINAIPQHSRAVYRHDRYGQIRDMLEPRLFSQYFSGEDGMMESPIEVQFVVRDTHAPANDPETTNSQNMSVFATSSLPFFDNTAFTLTSEGHAQFNTGRMRSSLPPDLEPPLDVTVDIELADEEVVG